MYQMVALMMVGLTLAASVAFAVPLKIIMIQALRMSAAALYILTRPNR
ncbi:hypothetical protein [Pacificibacter sp. AS14]